MFINKKLLGMEIDMKAKLRSWIELTIGTFLMSVAYKCIFDSASMVTGGFSGIGVIVRHLTFGLVDGGIPIWITNIVLNIPLFVAAFFIVGRKFLIYTAAGTAVMTFFLGVLPSSVTNEADLLLAAITGGLAYGIGVGLVLRQGASTGGTDMLAVVVHRFIKNYSVVRIMQILDAIIILSGMLVFGIRTSLYAMIAIYIGTHLSDRVMEGAESAKAVWIISDKYEEISQKLLNELGRGVTSFEGKGMYFGQKRNVMLCVVSKKQIPELKKIALETDEKVFFVIGDVREVCGEGFVQNIH